MEKIVQTKKILRSKLLAWVEKKFLRKKFQPVKLFGRRLLKWKGKKIPVGRFLTRAEGPVTKHSSPQGLRMRPK